MLNNVLEYLRITLYVILALIGYNLYNKWHERAVPVAYSPAAVQTVNSQVHSSPAPFALQLPQEKIVQPRQAQESHLIHVTTDVLAVDIDLRSGNIVGTNLLKYPATLHSSNSYPLLNQDNKNFYIAASGMLSRDEHGLTQIEPVVYHADKTHYVLDDQQNELIVPLWLHGSNGIIMNKEIIFKRSSYLINVHDHISNQTNQAWTRNFYHELTRTNLPPENDTGLSNFSTYFGAAISSADKPFEKISFKDMQQQNLSRAVTGGWAAMVQHYFVSAWIPQQNAHNEYYSKISNDNLYTIGILTAPVVVPAHGQSTVSTKLYSGPALTDALAQAAPGLQLTIDYGSLWIIAVTIFWLLQHVQNVIGNWGWSIIITTILIKILFYQLSAKSYRSMTLLKNLQPKIAQLKELHGDDKQKLTQATMNLYRQEKINPMAGCLPMIIQIPVFIALYWVLVESVQLRHAPFILWIHDLTAKDPSYVLPILVGLSMLVQQWLSPPPADPTQAKLMFLMPIIFTCLFINCPSGLMLYWFVNNLLSCLQQWYITRTIS